MPNRIASYLKIAFKGFLSFLTIFVLCIFLLFIIVSAPPEEEAPNSAIVNDVTKLNPINVATSQQPKTNDDIIALVKAHKGPVFIGGARHSMGGQIGTENALHIDMREFDDVLSFSKKEKEITVQAGITWRKIQEYIDPRDLSIIIMQSYANFTVGGSLSVNVHGRYIGQGPIIHSVKSIKMVLANGELISASSVENPELFFGCIGGYGGLGVIIEVTLLLAENCKVERRSTVMPIEDYHNYFIKNIRDDSLVVFQNADIYPDAYEEVRAISYVKTDKPLTIDERLKPLDSDYRMERFAMWIVSEIPGGNWIRKAWGDPIFYSQSQVKWQNYEASYDAFELEPTSRKNSTYVLQEYFVPIQRFDSFVPAMRKIFQKHGVNVINVSIRHARKDLGSLLAWAPTEVYCFVIYYKQGTSEVDRTKVGNWTKELIDAAISEGGAYYLPYQLHATEEQFNRAYPKANTFFNLKRKVDPTNKFRNKLWDAYYKP